MNIRGIGGQRPLPPSRRNEGGRSGEGKSESRIQKTVSEGLSLNIEESAMTRSLPRNRIRPPPSYSLAKAIFSLCEKAVEEIKNGSNGIPESARRGYTLTKRIGDLQSRAQELLIHRDPGKIEELKRALSSLKMAVDEKAAAGGDPGSIRTKELFNDLQEFVKSNL